jgi:glycosyltransferase involved in cell wall biosynthesis
MTAFNSDATVRSSIESALSFEIPADEIIIIDDCSTDCQN